MRTTGRVEIPLFDNVKTTQFYVTTKGDRLELHLLCDDKGKKEDVTYAMIPKGKDMKLIIEVRE